nr:ABSCISIC ACID-INSENSITIVE 5-like protein 7 [Ipomoea batatas]
MMGSYLDFKNFVETPQPEGNGGKPASLFPLARQSSIYSLTFDELQTTFSGLGKDFGSMNMEDLLKSIWTAEESQPFQACCVGAGDNGSVSGGNLQRQGSLTLPRTLSQKTVDEVWKDFQKDSGATKDCGYGGSSFGQRQSTLGEMTLEEFLFKAGVVREEMVPNSVGFASSVAQLNSMGFQEPGKQITDNNSGAIPGASNSMLNAGATRSTQQQPLQHHQQLQLHQPLFPKQTTLTFASPMQLGNNAQQASSGARRRPALGMASPPHNTNPVQGELIQGSANSMAGLRQNGAAGGGGGGSPGIPLSSDVALNSNLGMSSLSPTPYAFNEGGRGRRACNSIEKVVERRRRRMIKNRESAARSRARKQAYTIELEAEVEKLKEINQELMKKQAEFLEKRKNQMREKMFVPWESKPRCLKRTLTGPW